MNEQLNFIQEALNLAYDNSDKGGRPFGAVIVKDGKIIASSVNEILTTNDPTAHAELSAIRKASQILGSSCLDGCKVYASGHPCPMCLAAIHMVGIDEVYYAYSNEEAEPFGLSTQAVYSELAKPLSEQKVFIQYVPLRLDGKVDLYTYRKEQIYVKTN